jgi:hypothetical protein
MSTVLDLHNYIKDEKEDINSPRSETDYYLKVFKAHENDKWFLSWNWSAFFVPFYWLAYRKMLLPATIYFLIYFITTSIFPMETLYSAVYISKANVLPIEKILVWMYLIEIPMRFFVAIFGNSIYLNDLRRRIKTNSNLRGTSFRFVLLMVLLIVACEALKFLFS